MGKHIPGNPTIIFENMDAAGSRVAANWLFNIAPRDGSVVGALNQSTAFDPARKQEGMQFDAAKFGWIGKPVLDNLVTSASETRLLEIDESSAACFCDQPNKFRAARSCSQATFLGDFMT